MNPTLKTIEGGMKEFDEIDWMANSASWDEDIKDFITSLIKQTLQAEVERLRGEKISGDWNGGFGWSFIEGLLKDENTGEVCKTIGDVEQVFNSYANYHYNQAKQEDIDHLQEVINGLNHTNE